MSSIPHALFGGAAGSNPVGTYAPQVRYAVAQQGGGGAVEEHIVSYQSGST